VVRLAERVYLNISATSEEFFQADDALPTCEEQDVGQLSSFTDSDRDPEGDDHC
jgi:hypothetical protein